MGDDPRHTPEFSRALALFLKSPQTKLVRHIWTRMKDDPDYAVRNKTSIERVVSDILMMQGIDGEQVFKGATVFQLINEAAKKLKIAKPSEWYAQF